jgi:two-component system response regulator YesN
VSEESNETGQVESFEPRSHFVRRALEYVSSNFRHQITVPEVARASGVSPNYLSHRFRIECATTLTRFVHTLRVREARDLLRQEGRSIAEIAYLVGYQNYRDFHRNFVKLTRDSPREFRAKSIPGAPEKTVTGSCRPEQS